MARAVAAAGADAALGPVAAITFDFGNTLVRVDRPSLRAVVETTSRRMRDAGIVDDEVAFLAFWAEERERQFREEVPQLREVDVAQRVARILARLRGMAAPGADERWDDAAAAARSGSDEIALAVETYSAEFVARMPPMDGVEDVLRDLDGAGYRLGVLSNWPLAVTIDRYVAARGWDSYLRAIVVSQRIGVIKPHPAIFRAAEAAIGATASELLHVGDDWAADVVGARDAGWRVAYLVDHQADTPLPTSTPDAGVEPDLRLDRITDLPGDLAVLSAHAGHEPR